VAFHDAYPTRVLSLREIALHAYIVSPDGRVFFSIISWRRYKLVVALGIVSLIVFALALTRVGSAFGPSHTPHMAGSTSPRRWCGFGWWRARV
jgi:hypothetical protein